MVLYGPVYGPIIWAIIGCNNRVLFGPVNRVIIRVNRVVL